MPYARVVQKGNIGETYVYALQMYKNQTLVSRIRNDQEYLSFPSPQTWLTGTASSHTQTWEYATKKRWIIMNVKRNRTWLLFIACIILSIVFIFFSGVKNVTKSYGIVLLIFSILPIIPAILLTAKIKLPRIFTSGLTFIFYLL